MVAVTGYRGTSAQEKSKCQLRRRRTSPLYRESFWRCRDLTTGPLTLSKRWWHVSAYNSETVGWTWHFDPENRNKNVSAIAFSYEFGAKNISKIELEKWHFNTESYGLVVKVTPMLPYRVFSMTSLFSRNRARPPCRGTTAACISTVAIGLGGVVGLLLRYSRILWTIVRFCAVYGCINRSLTKRLTSDSSLSRRL